jgi:membrane-associated phospholipid phosphatase
MNQGARPLDRWLLRHSSVALSLAEVLAGVVLVVWIVIQFRGAFPGDRHFVSWMLDPHPAQPFAFLAHVFALLGHPIVAAVSVAIVWAVVDRRLGPRYGVLVFAAVGVVALNAILKLIFGPTPLQTKTFGPFAPSNFPSGHVVYATALCSLLGWLALARGNRLLFASMVVVIVCMGPCRVIDGAHWPSDVLAGYCLGLAWTIAVLVLGLPWASGQAIDTAD